MKPLTEATLREGIAGLARRDADLASVVERHGPPPMWDREPGFATLLKTILEQQVSVASAAAAFDRLLEVVGILTPDSFLAQDDVMLRRVGFSRQKTRYGRILAEALRNGSLDHEAVERLDDDAARDVLTTLSGIGLWTADTYLLMALLRPDVWPAGDVALQAAVQDVKGLQARPTHDEMVDLGEAWRPWRAVAARILWFHYLGGRP